MIYLFNGEPCLGLGHDRFPPDSLMIGDRKIPAMLFGDKYTPSKATHQIQLCVPNNFRYLYAGNNPRYSIGFTRTSRRRIITAPTTENHDYLILSNESGSSEDSKHGEICAYGFLDNFNVIDHGVGLNPNGKRYNVWIYRIDKYKYCAFSIKTSDKNPLWWVIHVPSSGFVTIRDSDVDISILSYLKIPNVDCIPDTDNIFNQLGVQPFNDIKLQTRYGEYYFMNKFLNTEYSETSNHKSIFSSFIRNELKLLEFEIQPPFSLIVEHGVEINELDHI